MFPDFMTTAQDGGKVVSLTHRPPLPPGNAYDFMSMKNPLTLAGIEPATFRFVAEHLKHCATVVPEIRLLHFIICQTL